MIICLLSGILKAQQGISPSGVPALFDVKVRKYGPYIGLQRGKYTVVEFGGEFQWKKVKIKKPITHAVHTGFNYNFKYNVLGYDAGYWIRPSRIGLTYGANLVFRTDFDASSVGLAPVIGYKFWLLHLQTGYHFLSRPANDFETNKFFVSLRIGIINDRKIKVDRDK